MDSGAVVASGRWKSIPSKWGRSYEGEDMISKLPDSIIGHILSLVPIEDAVQTCVLSKRWINLWKFVTNIFFQDRDRSTAKTMEKQRFVNLVNGVMLHLNSLSIQSFSLSISEEYDPSFFNEWISAVLSGRLKKLQVDTVHPLTFPCYSLVQFQYLEELMLKYDFVIRVPSNVCFSSLTVLKMYFITLAYDHESSNNSEYLTLKFPILRELEVKGCSWLGAKNVTLEVPLVQVVSNFSICIGSSREVKFKLCASHLKKFRYDGFIEPHPCFSDLFAANIASASIHLFHYDKYCKEVVNQACKLVKQFACNVECLRVQWSQVVELAKDSFADPSESKVLTRLEFDSVTIEILLGLLLKTPVLKTLIFEKIFQFDKELLNSAKVPDCFRRSLQMVEFEFFDGSEHELSFAKFVMENAQVLEKIRFRPVMNLCYSKLMELKAKVFSFEKACRAAVIEFVYFDFSSVVKTGPLLELDVYNL